MSSSGYIGRDPNLDARFLRSVEEAVQANDLQRAVQMARQGLADGLLHPMLLNLRAFGYENEGRDREALADLHQAVELAPTDPMIRNAYGLILAKHQKTQDAINAFEEAARLAPDFPQAHFNLGWAKETTGDLLGGKASLEKAIALMPGLADAWSRLAQNAFRRGDFPKAREAGQQALDIDQRQFLALNTLAQVEIAQGNIEAAREFIDRGLADPTIPPLNRAQLRNTLGDILHAQGRFADAFISYEAANNEEHALYASQFDAPGRETAYTYAVWAAEYFSAAPTSEWSVAAARKVAPAESRGGTKAHIFLAGFPRSGTTLLENVLTSHPDIVALEEKATLADATRTFFDNAAGLERLRQFRPADATQQRAIYWRHVGEFGAEPAGKVLIDKNPLNTIKLPMVARLFPSAKILFALRDPRDVVISCFRRSFLMNASMFELTTLARAARFYDAVMTLADIYRAKLGLDWYDLKHEILIDDFEAETRRVCAFIGVDWTPELAQFAEHAKSRPIATPSSNQVMKGLNREGVGYWRNYREQMAPILPVLAPWVEKFGYPKE